MGYVKKIVNCGKIIEVEKYKTTKGKGRTKENKKPTSEEQKKINHKNRVKELKYKIATNFSEDGAHVILTYKKEERPETLEEAEKNLTKFLRKTRDKIKNEKSESEKEKEKKKLKYIARTETGKSGKNFHHHLIINITDIKIYKENWTKGFIRIMPLNKNDDYKKLVEYLLKEECEKNAWRCSKGLKTPKIKKEKLKSNDWKEEPKPIKGYYILKDSIENGVTGWGFKYQRYTMIKIRE